jgi:hypothetical protein
MSASIRVLIGRTLLKTGGVLGAQVTFSEPCGRDVCFEGAAVVGRSTAMGAERTAGVELFDIADMLLANSIGSPRRREDIGLPQPAPGPGTRAGPSAEESEDV